MFKVNRKTLAAELALLATTAERKTTIPILSTVRFEFANDILTLTGTDIDMTIIAKIAANGEPWSGCVPSKQLNDLVRLFGDEDEIEFTSKPNGRIQVKWGKSKHLLPTYPVSEFPPVDDVSVDEVVIDGMALSNAISRALRCISSDAKETWMHGVSFCSLDGKLFIAGTNSRHFAVSEIPTTLSVDVLVPQRAASALVRFLDGESSIGASENHAVFRRPNRVFITRLMDVKFPDWRPLVPPLFKHSFTVDNEAAKQSFKLASVTAKEAALISIPLKVTVSKNEMFLETRESEIGQSTEVLPIECPTLNGDSLTMGVNGAHFISFMDAETKPRISFNDDMRMFQLSVEGEPNYRYITMALKV